jgi:hypothetical protein
MRDGSTTGARSISPEGFVFDPQIPAYLYPANWDLIGQGRWYQINLKIR